MVIDTFVRKKLKELREQQGWTLEHLSKKMNTTPITLSRYETGKRSVSLQVLDELCKIYQLDIQDFFQHEKPHHHASQVISTNLGSVKSIDIYGTIAAGTLTTAVEDIIDSIDLPQSLIDRFSPDTLFGLQVTGESMNKIIPNGNYAIFQKQKHVTNGDIVAALVNGEDATLKRFFRLDAETIVLKPESFDPEFQPISIDLRDIYTSFEILGKMIWHCSPTRHII